jgi:hypothetical protein
VEDQGRESGETEREERKIGNSFLQLYTDCGKYGGEKRLEGEVFPV